MADFKHDERVIIYPAYLNKNKSVQEGRRIAKQQGIYISSETAKGSTIPSSSPLLTFQNPLPPFQKTTACNNPLTPEIYDCATKGLNLKAEPESKIYPRDWMYRGRVRVQLKNDDGSPVNPSIPTSTLMFSSAYLCIYIYIYI